MRPIRSGGMLMVTGLLALAASQGGCILGCLPHYEPGFACEIEFRDAETGELIEGDVLMVEHESESSWTEVYIIAGPVTPQGPFRGSSDLSRVRTGSRLSQWGHCIVKIPIYLGLGAKRKFFGWHATVFRDGYTPEWITDDRLAMESDEHDGPVVIEMQPISNDLAPGTLSDTVDDVVGWFLPEIPKLNPHRRELLLLLERQAVQILDAAEKNPPAARYYREHVLPRLRDTTLPKIRQAIVDEPR